ncbi:AAA family ATPase [uncultured Tateyamaria sp.]|uniref:AAA family ATPase n=1 Tax=uncultured Tateyamaria sp. TaxID=455651 RepID=UPI00262E1BEB|nr:AAA family ATPase [uncultured Tateyamaria sp.]
MKRVMIVGGPGSGKSTLARLLGQRTGLPVHHMDHIHWLPDWTQRPRDLRGDMAIRVERGEEWIFEGGFSTTYDHRVSRADTLIWLDMPVSLCLWRVTKRLFLYWGQRRPDMAEGCVEGIHGETLEFYRFIWRTRHSGRVRLQALIAGAPETLSVRHLTHPRAVRCFLEDLS